MKQIIIFPTGALSAKDKERMSKEGYLAIESDDPSKVIMPLPSSEILTNDLLMAALEGVQRSHYSQQTFAEALHNRLKAKEGK